MTGSRPLHPEAGEHRVLAVALAKCADDLRNGRVDAVSTWIDAHADEFFAAVVRQGPLPGWIHGLLEYLLAAALIVGWALPSRRAGRRND